MSSNAVTSPIKNIPSCWEDDKRMTALYAPFRIREANPVDYDSKMKFWESNIENWCLEKNNCKFSVKMLQKEFKRKERVPLCLNTVIENLERIGHIKLKDDIYKMNPEESWTEWAVKCFVKTPVVWSFAKLKTALMERDIDDLEYVYINYLKKRSEEIVLRMENKNNNLYNTVEFQKLLTSEEIEIDLETFDILVLWMQINKIILVHKLENDTLFKFIDGKKNTSITDVDVSIYMLEKNKLSIEKAIEALEREKEELIETAKNFLRKGMRDTAKSYLRRKKALEKTLEKRINTSENIEILLSRIHEVSSDSKVLETYKIGLNALKATFKENGLSEDDVTNTISEIQEINEMHEEIQTALSEPVSTPLESELEEELKSILESVKEVEKNIVLPEVPTHEPKVTVKEKGGAQLAM
ncbi:charged multivesicular body protein 7 [Halyomorpha halys]|uniref:charged multivesicular body protein 7 n=1 Tax=Halyomorpha halys TaxID=286706 RepID=UPI0006D50582|nr:charged multivesicular body protein 7 [Halyomorpha halys]